MLELCYKLGHYAGIMHDALTMPLCSKLCQHNVSNPSNFPSFLVGTGCMSALWFRLIVGSMFNTWASCRKSKSSSSECFDFWPQTNVILSSRVGREEALICHKFVTSQRGVFIGSSCLFCAILCQIM